MTRGERDERLRVCTQVYECNWARARVCVCVPNCRPNGTRARDGHQRKLPPELQRTRV